MPRRHVSPRNVVTPIGVVKWVRLPLRKFKKLSHESALPVSYEREPTVSAALIRINREDLI